jgi:hypothetical protein
MVILLLKERLLLKLRWATKIKVIFLIIKIKQVAHQTRSAIRLNNFVENI